MGFGPSMAPPNLRPSEVDNIVRWNEESKKRGLSESYFLNWRVPNSVSKGLEDPVYKAYTIQFTLLQSSQNHTAPVGEIFVLAFDGDGDKHIAEKVSVPQQKWKLERENCFVRFDTSEFRHGHTEGTIQGDKHQISWSLDWEARVWGLRQFPFDWMYTRRTPHKKLTTPVPDTRVKGWIEIDGVKHEFEGAPGMQGHHWAESHPPRWAWAHANNLTGKGRAIFEGVANEMHFGPFKIPWSTILYMEYDGEPILMNRPFVMIRSFSKIDGLQWSFRSQDKRHRLEGHFEAESSAFIGANYYNPDGRLIRCMKTNLASGEIRLYRKTDNGMNLLDTFHCERNASLEFGLPSKTPGIAIHIP
jgi:hypothetical protein